ncbi:RNA polymerase recycling motor ATPase HelR [Catenuloplanes japonicus]|uniref:RNA polymerase recycling motor ATPase HelR n=1 Tax=Catenuloplanes japonicus TaxID=33876 RepID=UPI0005272F03|nr:RNA polymerase recycling motor ATPase HelR [Catenuloplanes japonicus]
MQTTSVFDLREQAKTDPTLIADDERHFAAMAASTRAQIEDLSDRLNAVRKNAAGRGRQAVERDEEAKRLAARLRTLRRYSLDLCLGRMIDAVTGEAVYIGRLGLTDSEGRRLLTDWRSPAAEPFFGGTHKDPMGLASRRRYRWTRGRITDYWDEVFTAEGLEGHAALDDQSAFIAGLGGSRSDRMRDVLGTIQADQDAIIRAGSRGALVVDGGPGTGKTVVALHRTAYLLYSDPRLGLGRRRGGVLFVGPHEPYLAYVSDVLPSLGEDDVQTCTLRDLVPEGATAVVEEDPEVARLKSSKDMVDAVEAAVRFYEAPPDTNDWAEAFAAAAGTPHNEARELIWEELIAIRDDADADERRRDRETLLRAWPMLDAADLIADLWSVPAYLRRCAPHLTADEVRKLQRKGPWTTADLPLLDAARQRLGDAGTDQRQRQRQAAVATQRARMATVIDDLIDSSAYDDGEGLMKMLVQKDLHDVLVNEDVLPDAQPDALAGPFAHIVVDEAQELTDAEWQMLLLRCPSRSLTIVGDRAQARRPFPESWQERLTRIGLDSIRLSSLTVNYRTPAEVMAEAEPIIRAALPDANVPSSIRSSGLPVVHAKVEDLDLVLSAHLHDDGVACVIGHPAFDGTDRVRALTPELAKGLEFDLVVLIDPQSWPPVDRYVAMTRATRQLVILT